MRVENVRFFGRRRAVLHSVPRNWHKIRSEASMNWNFFNRSVHGATLWCEFTYGRPLVVSRRTGPKCEPRGIESCIKEGFFGFFPLVDPSAGDEPHLLGERHFAMFIFFSIG